MHRRLIVNIKQLYFNCHIKTSHLKIMLNPLFLEIKTSPNVDELPKLNMIFTLRTWGYEYLTPYFNVTFIFLNYKIEFPLTIAHLFFNARN